MENYDLIVLGNGFDLWCNLNTRYTDYVKDRRSKFPNLYNTLDNYMKNAHDVLSRTNLTINYISRNMGVVCNNLTSEISLWEFYFYIKNYKHNGEIEWKNIENDILSFFRNNTVRYICVHNLYSYLLNLPDLNEIQTQRIDNSSFMSYTFGEVIHELFEQINEQNDAYCESKRHLKYAIGNHDDRVFSDFLVNELHRFEVSFTSFIWGQLDQNIDFNSRALKLFEIITKPKNLGDGSMLEINSPYFLSFNYTLPNVKEVWKNGSNVHGYIGDSENSDASSIIIGIDQEQIKGNYSYEYLFTKTYRKLFLKQTLKSQPLPKKESTKRIIFMGHSYGKADYSYFRSIFDYYDIESSKIELIFNYSIYDPQKSHDISQKQFTDVYNLLIDYSGQANKASGKNLIHRLLLENRISILEVDETEYEKIQILKHKTTL